MIFATELVDGNGKVIQHNFVPFKVNGKVPAESIGNYTGSG